MNCLELVCRVSRRLLTKILQPNLNLHLLFMLATEPLFRKLSYHLQQTLNPLIHHLIPLRHLLRVGPGEMKRVRNLVDVPPDGIELPPDVSRVNRLTSLCG